MLLFERSSWSITDVILMHANKSRRLFGPSSPDMALLAEGGQSSPIFYKPGPPDGGWHAEILSCYDLCHCVEPGSDLHSR
jgi:hypothetical protein